MGKRKIFDAGDGFKIWLSQKYDIPTGNNVVIEKNGKKIENVMEININLKTGELLTYTVKKYSIFERIMGKIKRK